MILYVGTAAALNTYLLRHLRHIVKVVHDLFLLSNFESQHTPLCSLQIPILRRGGNLCELHEGELREIPRELLPF